MNKKIIIAGGTGFLGECLAAYFSEKGFDIIILSRKEKKAEGKISFVKWDGETLGLWQKALEGSTALINLSGRSVDCRYNEKNKKEIMDSRVHSTLLIGKAIQACAAPPKLWMNASSATIYRHAEDRAMDEHTGEIGEGFSVEVCRAWEKAFAQSEIPGTRKVALRISMVLSKRSGVMTPIMNLVRFGMGGALAGGKQYISWIHEKDFVRMLEWILEHEGLSGAINICSSNPVTNAEFMRSVRKEMKMPFGMPQPKWVLSFGSVLLQTETELIVKSRRVIPAIMKESGFEFIYPTMQDALEEVVSSK